MKTYTIEQKMSGTGTIHDISSDLFDRVINFKKGEIFAVVSSSYYGNGGFYSTHRTDAATIKKSRALTKSGYSHDVIDPVGNRYSVNGDRLDKID